MSRRNFHERRRNIVEWLIVYKRCERQPIDYAGIIADLKGDGYYSRNTYDRDIERQLRNDYVPLAMIMSPHEIRGGD